MKQRFTLIELLILILISIQFCQADDFLAARKAAKTLEQQERYLEALDVFVSAAERTDSDHARTSCLREAAEIAVRRLDNAETALKIADRLRDPVEVQRLRMMVFHHEADSTRMLQETGEIDLSQWTPPARLEAAYYRGFAYLRTEDWTSAAQDFQLAADTPGRPHTRVTACHHLGDIYRDQLDDTKRAIAAYRQGLEVTRASYAHRNRCLLSLADLLAERGDIDDALALFDDVDLPGLSSDYWRVAFLSTHAKLHHQAGNLGTAATLYTRILRLGGASQPQKDHANQQIDAIIAAMKE